jgi:putative chitinase
MRRSAREWNNVLLQCGVRPTTAAIWSTVFAAAIGDGTFSLGDAELDDFLGQALEESAMLERMEENLNYSAARMTVVWPGRFPTLEAAQPFAHNPQALARRVYGCRKDLGNDTAQDGWTFRARGFGITGKSNYAAIARLCGIDCLNTPELLSEPANALHVFVKWWEGHVPDAVMGKTRLITRIVNGGQTGEAEREKLTIKAGKALA